jgi:hypothetical protein
VFRKARQDRERLAAVAVLTADAEMKGATGVRVADLRKVIGGRAAVPSYPAAAERTLPPGADPLTGCMPVTADGK